MELNPTTDLMLSVIYWRDAAADKLADAAQRLMAAGARYLAAQAAGEVVAGGKDGRLYTEQLAFAAKHCALSRPHEREMAIEQIREIELLAIEEQRMERDAAKAPRLAEPKPLNPNRHDVRMGLIGGGD